MHFIIQFHLFGNLNYPSILEGLRWWKWLINITLGLPSYPMTKVFYVLEK